MVKRAAAVSKRICHFDAPVAVPRPRNAQKGVRCGDVSEHCRADCIATIRYRIQTYSLLTFRLRVAVDTVQSAFDTYVLAVVRAAAVLCSK